MIMKINVKKKTKHVLNIFNSKTKKYIYYYKPRSFFKKNFVNNMRVLLNKQNLSINKSYGIIALESIYLPIPPFLACIKHIKKSLKLLNLNSSFLNIYVFPDFVITSKPREVRMGGGKGEPSHKVCLLQKGHLILSITHLKPLEALKILRPCQNKLPLKSNIFFSN